MAERRGVSRARRRLPRSALEPLMECCEYLSERLGSGESAVSVFRRVLEGMRRYGDFFFDHPWTERAEWEYGLSDEELGFIEGGETFEERGERYTLVCLRRNISMEGLDKEEFIGVYNSYGRGKCWGCSVREAMRLRRMVREQREARREVEEKMSRGEPSVVLRDWHEHLNRPETVREDKKTEVELRLYEELGGAGGKVCDVENAYICPYGEESKRLVEDGELVRSLWYHVEWYNHHWNPHYKIRPSPDEARWYHWGEPGIMDVTSYEDVLNALEDGRIDRIIREHERYMEETGRGAWAP